MTSVWLRTRSNGDGERQDETAVRLTVLVRRVQEEERGPLLIEEVVEL